MTQDELLPVVARELVRVVDTEVLTELGSPQPQQQQDGAAQAAAKQVEILKEKVRRAVLRAAVAEDDLLAEYQEVAVALKKEQAEAEERLRLHRHVEKEGGPALWSEWWAEVRPGLVLESDDPELIEELLESRKLLPALAKVQGRGGFDEFKEKARKALVRLAEDGDSDPLRSIMAGLLDGRRSGILVDLETLRGVLRRLGCEITLWWKPNTQRKLSRDPKWVLDRGSIKIDFRWSGHSSRTTFYDGRDTVKGGSPGHGSRTTSCGGGS